MGGENQNTSRLSAAWSGSSPRGRGKPWSVARNGWVLGLIPAWAGKTELFEVGESPSRAHPRVGGENQPSRGGANHREGSSPRGRGKLVKAAAALDRSRLIPAWAGKTKHVTAPVTPTPAHPRVGGENEIEALLDPEQQGSSPRGRGKLTVEVLVAQPVRLIPAWAGKTSSL